jgi:2-(1,2-epoxy-1,2-dihydrophenyl)acetyl-CoA isomerase
LEQAVEPFVGFHLENGIGYITLNRPQARNSINEAMFESLMDQLRVLVLRAQGNVFCAGGDIQLFRQLLTVIAADRQQQLARYIGLAHRAIAALLAIPCPVVAALQGAAAGYGMSLACAADIIIAEQGCQLVPAYMALGATPDGGLTYLLPALIGNKRTLEMLWLNRALSVEEALGWGLVNRVCPPGALDQAVAEVAAPLSRGPGQAQRNLKRLVTQHLKSQLSQQMDQELNSFLACAASADFVEGVQAFLERRPVAFNGD